MDLKAAQALLPASHPLRRILAGLVDADDEKRDAAFHKLGELREKEPKVSKAIGTALLRIATELPLLPQQFDWNDSAHELLFPLVDAPNASYLEGLRAAYTRVPRRAQCAVLSAIGAIGTKPAARAFIELLREHGWPKGGVYGRVFTELRKLAKFADVLFPELVLLSGDEIGDVTDVMIGALAAKHLDPRKVDLEPIAPVAKKQLARALAAAEKRVKPGLRWRFSEGYAATRTIAGAWLDVAGHLKDKALLPLLAKGMRSKDPKLAAFGALSLLQRKQKVPAAVLEKIAASHETRVMVFDYLERMNALAKFPKKWRTWDAFAAAEMVGWLSYPSELGREPDDLHLMQKLQTGKQSLYVWKFLDGKKWQAGVSGPYILQGKPRPLYGASTFSVFAAAASATPEEHALSVLKTLSAWRKK
jgi:hypothetical protein